MVSFRKALPILSTAASSISAFASVHEHLQDKHSKFATESRHLQSGKAPKDREGGPGPKSGKAQKARDVGAVYTMSNDDENEILIYSRDGIDGSLTFEGRESTNGGIGYNVGLISSNSIIVAGKCLLAVNGMSNDVSTFRIHSVSEIEHMGNFNTSGTFPVSIAEQEGLVYALNGGGNGSIQGYTLTQYNCGLRSLGKPIELRQRLTVSPIPPNSNTLPGQIGFTPEGNLLVTVKIEGGLGAIPSGAPGSLNFYEINPVDLSTSDDALTQELVTLNDGPVIPFSFVFDDQDSLFTVDVVSGNFTSTGAIARFVDGERVERVRMGQPASCWIEYNKADMCLYTGNSGSSSLDFQDGSISSFSTQGGPLVLAESDAASVPLAGDVKISPDYQYLYAISNGDLVGTSSIHVYKTVHDCGLELVEIMTDGFDQTSSVVSRNTEAGLALYDP